MIAPSRKDPKRVWAVSLTVYTTSRALARVLAREMRARLEMKRNMLATDIRELKP